MALPIPVSSPQPVDLTGPPALVREADWLNRFTPGRSRQQALDALTAEEDPRERNRRLNEVLRKMDLDETVEILKTGAKLQYREDRALDFIHADGTPKLPERPEEREVPDLNLKELVRMQLNNEAFILGILDNPKATALPGLVPMIVSLSRSLRVLDRVMRGRETRLQPRNPSASRATRVRGARGTGTGQRSRPAPSSSSSPTRSP